MTKPWFSSEGLKPPVCKPPRKDIGSTVAEGVDREAAAGAESEHIVMRHAPGRAAGHWPCAGRQGRRSHRPRPLPEAIDSLRRLTKTMIGRAPAADPTRPSAARRESRRRAAAARQGLRTRDGEGRGPRHGDRNAAGSEPEIRAETDRKARTRIESFDEHVVSPHARA